MESGLRDAEVAAVQQAMVGRWNFNKADEHEVLLVCRTEPGNDPKIENWFEVDWYDDRSGQRERTPMKSVPDQPDVRLAFSQFFGVDEVRKQLRLNWKHPGEADVVVEVECVPDHIGLNGTKVLGRVSRQSLVMDLANLLAVTEIDGPLIHELGDPEHNDPPWLFSDFYGESGLPQFETELLQFCWCRTGERASFGVGLLTLGLPQIQKYFERYGTLDHTELIHLTCNEDSARPDPTERGDRHDDDSPR